MTSIRTAQDAAEFLGRLYEGLDDVPSKTEAAAVREAISALPEDALVTEAALDRLGLDEGLRAAVIFQLLADRYPAEVGDGLRAADTMSGVFKELSGVHDLSRDLSNDLPRYLAGFISDLVGIDEERSRTGEDVMATDFSEHALAGVDATQRTVMISAVSNEGGETYDLRLQISDGAWSAEVSERIEGQDPEPDESVAVTQMNLDTLDMLLGVLEPVSADGALTEDPLLSLHRKDLETKEGNLLPDLISHVREVRDAKRQERAEHIDAIDEALRKNLGEFRVGEADQGDLNDAAEAALKDAE